jgi:hypothetical protein
MPETTPDRRRETELLVWSVRAALGRHNTAQTAYHIEQDLDWAYLASEAIQHGVTAHLYRSLSTTCGRGRVPVPVWHQLRNQFEATARTNLLLTQELLALLTLFEAHCIPAMPLKGPVLAVLVYGNTALRQFGDLDIFVPADRAEHAKDLMTARGYRFGASRETDVAAERESHGCRVPIDLQWGLAPKRFRFPLDLDELWNRREPVRLGGVTVWQPAPADYALILSAHAAKHCWSRLGLISDMAAFIETHRTRLDWREAVDCARERGGERCLLLGLRLAHDVLGVEVPSDLAARVQADTRVASLASELRERLFVPRYMGKGFQGSYSPLTGGLLFMRTRERLRDRVPYASYLLGRPLRPVTRVIMPSDRDRAVVALPRYAAFLYYLIRPIRVIRTYAPTLLQWYRGRRKRTFATDAAARWQYK